MWRSQICGPRDGVELEAMTEWRRPACGAFVQIPLLLASLLAPLPSAGQEAPPAHHLQCIVTIPGAGNGGAHFLTGVVTVIESVEGTLVVHDRNPEPSLLAFDAEGRFLYRIGREGRGPAEYLMIDALGFLGDTLWVTDPRQRRVTWYRRGDRLRV